MHNFVGQDIQTGDYVGQSARHPKGVHHRIGVVLGTVIVSTPQQREEHPELRIAWFEPDADPRTYESTVRSDRLFKLDKESLGSVPRKTLYWAKQRGRG